MTAPILSDRLFDPLAHAILRLIDDAGIREGGRLPSEARLCAELSVSRPALREALRALETLGIVVARKGSGRILRPMSFDGLLAGLGQTLARDSGCILDVLAVRQVLEFNLLPVAAPHIPESGFAELHRLADRMESKAELGEDFSQEDRRFHALLYEGLGNKVLLGLLALFWEMFQALNPRDLVHQESIKTTAARHRKILQCLQAGDIRQAQFHLDTHFYDVAWVLSHRTAAAEASSPKP